MRNQLDICYYLNQVVYYYLWMSPVREVVNPEGDHVIHVRGRSAVFTTFRHDQDQIRLIWKKLSELKSNQIAPHKSKLFTFEW